MTAKIVASDLGTLLAGGRRFGTIYADPPWLYNNQATRAATSNHYSGMTVDQICALPISELAAQAAHLHLWVTSPFLFEAWRIFDAWGFKYDADGTFVWLKREMGLGNYWRNATELLLTATRGDPKPQFQDVDSYLICSRGKHSAKPERVRHLIEKTSPPPRLELFGRAPSPGWTVWGNQIEFGLFDGNVQRIPSIGLEMIAP
jgi:N6-adenosine-specific RNA methylase IME4